MPLNREDEKKLIKSIQKATSDLDSLWAKLKGEYDRSVFRCAQTATRTRADAEVVAQEAWVKFWKDVGNFDPDRSPVMPYLRVIVSHTAAELYRRLGKPMDSIDDPGDNDGDRTPRPRELRDPGESAEKRLIRKEALEARQKQYALMLKLTFHLDSPPHLKLAFGFLRLLEWKAGEIVTRWSPDTLDLAGEALEKDYAGEARVRLKDVRTAFDGLRRDLDAPVKWEHVNAMRAGSTILETYFAVREFEARKQKIQGWADTVRRKLTVRLAILLPDERIDGGTEK